MLDSYLPTPAYRTQSGEKRAGEGKWKDSLSIPCDTRGNRPDYVIPSTDDSAAANLILSDVDRIRRRLHDARFSSAIVEGVCAKRRLSAWLVDLAGAIAIPPDASLLLHSR